MYFISNVHISSLLCHMPNNGEQIRVSPLDGSYMVVSEGILYKILNITYKTIIVREAGNQMIFIPEGPPCR